MARFQRLIKNNCYKFLSTSDNTKASVNGAVSAATAGSKSKVFVLWDGAVLLLVNFPLTITEEFNFKEKQMTLEEIPGSWRKRTKFQVKECRPYDAYKVEGIYVIRTLQGFWHRSVLWAARNGYQVHFEDLRCPDLLPEPRFDLMHGFRFNQREFTEAGLAWGKSGIFSACTRYGKSTVIRNIIRAFPDVTIALIVPGVSLIQQTVAELKEAFPDREVKQIGGGSRVKYPSDDINVVSMDSLHKLDPAMIRLVIVDEPHAVVSAGRLPGIGRFDLARLYAVGATTGQEGMGGRYDGRDAMLEGIFGPVLSKVTYKDAVAMGAVCQIKVAMVKIPIPRVKAKREQAMKKFVLENPVIHRVLGKLAKEYLPKEDQALFFIKQQKQAELIQRHVGDHIPIVMDKLLTKKEREDLTKKVEKDHLSQVLCSDIFVQGVTFHHIRYLINCSGGGPSTSAIQRPGRLAEIRPDKTHGVMIDFMPIVEKPDKNKPAVGHVKEEDMSGLRAIASEARKRKEVYEKIGYIVEEVEIDDLKRWIDENNTHEGKEPPFQLES